MKLTPDAVLEKLRRAAQANAGFIVSVHASVRLAERGLTRRDLASAFLTAHHAERQDAGSWKISGLDDDGVPLHVICLFGAADRIEVITTF